MLGFDRWSRAWKQYLAPKEAPLATERFDAEVCQQSPYKDNRHCMGHVAGSYPTKGYIEQCYNCNMYKVTIRKKVVFLGHIP